MLKIVAAGHTGPGDWKDASSVDASGTGGIFVDVECNYDLKTLQTQPPIIFTSLHGEVAHWDVSGATSIYFRNPTPPPGKKPTDSWFLKNVPENGFRIYLVRPTSRSTKKLTPKEAKDSGWFVHWILVDYDA